MYSLISNLMFGQSTVPTNVNTTLVYVAGAIVLVITVLLADMIFRLLKSVFGRSQY